MVTSTIYWLPIMCLGITSPSVVAKVTEMCGSSQRRSELWEESQEQNLEEPKFKDLVAKKQPIETDKEKQKYKWQEGVVSW